MKNSIKIVLIIITVFIGIILLDSIQSLLFNNNPLIGIETKCMKKEGILVDTYHCGNGKNITKFKSFACNNEKVCNKNNRYNEIKESIREGVNLSISAVNPNCINVGEFNNEDKAPATSFINSSNLINNGYINRNELLDVDGISYCDVYVVFKEKGENKCTISYKIYLKCKDYEDEGYINWN